jgi:hypothetical protein
MPVRLYPAHNPPQTDTFAGTPRLHDALGAIAAGRGWGWRLARPSERVGYVAPDPNAEPPVEEVIPDGADYALELPFDPTVEELAALDTVVEAWKPYDRDLDDVRAKALLVVVARTRRRTDDTTFTYAVSRSP